MSNTEGKSIKSMNRQVPAVDPRKCNHCNACIGICPRHAILEPMQSSCAKCVKYCIFMQVPCSPEKLVISYELCDSCGLCISSCPQGALFWFTPECSDDSAGVKKLLTEGIYNGNDGEETGLLK